MVYKLEFEFITHFVQFKKVLTINSDEFLIHYLDEILTDVLIQQNGELVSLKITRQV